MTDCFEKDALVYGTADAPEGWTPVVERVDSCFGYGYPFGFRLKAASPGSRSVLCFYCPLRYEDDSRYEFPKNELKVTDYGKLLRPYMDCAAFLDVAARRYLQACQDVTLVWEGPFGGDAAAYAKRSAVLTEAGQRRCADKRDLAFEGAGALGLTRIYSYNYKGYARRRAMSARLEWETTAEYVIVSIPPTLLRDPFSRQALSSMYDRIDAQRGEGVTLFRRVTCWEATRRFSLDAPAEDFDALYRTAYPAFLRSLTLADSLWAALRKKQAEVDAVNAEKHRRQEQEEDARRQQRQREFEAQRQRQEEARQARQRLYQTQQETSRIITTGYEERSRRTDEANRRWSESFRGRYTYVDRHGREYTAEGYGKYAFTDGFRVVTTDDPRGPGFGWEEVRRK